MECLCGFVNTAILLMDGANIAGLMSGLPGWGFTSSQLYRMIVIALTVVKKKTPLFFRFKQYSVEMCGRAACALDPNAFHKAVTTSLGKEVRPRSGAPQDASGGAPQTAASGANYNISPGAVHHVVYKGSHENAVLSQPSQWGTRMVPGQNKLVINARIESLLEKATFRKMSTCLIYLSGYYEWCVQEERQPYYFSKAEEGLLCCAGLVDVAKGEFVVLTTTASEKLAWCHARSPVFLEAEEQQTWLSLGTVNSSLADVAATLEGMEKKAHHNANHIAWHPVTREIGKVAFNEPTCIAPAEASAPQKAKRKRAERPPCQPSIRDIFGKKEKVKVTQEEVCGNATKRRKVETAKDQHNVITIGADTVEGGHAVLVLD